MPHQVLIKFGSNNEELIKLFLKVHLDDGLKFEKESHHSPYYFYLVDLGLDLSDISQKVISEINQVKNRKQKFILGLLFADKIDIEKVHHFRQLLQSLDKDSIPSWRLVLINDLYQDALDRPVTYLDNLIDRSLKNDTWNTTKKGNHKFTPLYYLDLVDALVKIFFLNNTAGKTYWLLGDPISDLEIGYLIKNSYSDSETNFQIESNLPSDTKNDEYLNSARDTQINLDWRPDTDFALKLSNLIDQQKQELTEPEIVPKKGIWNKFRSATRRIIPHHRQEGVHQNIKNQFLRKTVGFVCILMLLYLMNGVIFSVSMYREYKNLNTSLELISQDKLSASVDEISKVESINKLNQQLYDPIRPLLTVVSPVLAEELNNLFNFNQYLTKSLQNFQQTYNLADKIYKSFTDSQSYIDPSEATLALQSNLSLIYDNLRQIKISLDSQQLPKFLVDNFKNSIEYTKLDRIQEQLTQAMKLADLMPLVLDAKGSKKIGILVQDQDELRPTGGLIKQLVVLQFDHGKLTGIKSYLPSELDSLAEGTAQAPPILANITGTTQYEFKDMNYPADFSQTGQYITWYLDRVSNLRLDMLIGLEKSFFEKLLQEDQAIRIDNRVIKPQDLYSVSSSSDISKPVVDYYLSALKSGNLSLPQIGRAILSEIEAGNIRLYSQDEATQNMISNLPLSGSVLEHFCTPGLEKYKNCLNQTTFLNEANFSFVPLNHSLSRDVTHLITINPQSIDHEYDLEYSFNTDLTSVGKPYIVIYQLFAPQGSELNKVTVDGSDLSLTQLSKLIHGQFDYYQFPVSFPMTGKHSVKIDFSTKTGVIDIQSTAFSFTEIRQPGLSDSGTLLVVKIPDNSRPVILSQPIQSVQGGLAAKIPPRTATFGIGLSY